MLKLAWRGVRHNAGRYVATLVAIITGVAFFAAAGFLSDRVIDALEGDVNREFAAVDAAVVPDTDSDFAADVRLPGDVVDEIEALPAVEGVAGVFTGPVAFLEADGVSVSDGATGRLWVDDPELNPINVIDGAAPAAPGEIAVDRVFAESESLSVGQQVTLLGASGKFPATVVGITEFGSSGAVDRNGTVSITSNDIFTWLNAGVVEYTELYVRGSASQQELVDAITPVTPAGFVVKTGADFLNDKRTEASAFGRFLKIGLQVFAMLALFVGGFVIYNTFSVIVAQRLRELAVLAAIGATPRQLKRSLRFEGLVIGLIGSALGVLAGFGLTFALIAILQAVGFELPGSGLKLSPNVVLQGIIVGTAITFFSVMIPARRAAKTEPIEALRQAAVETGTIPRRRKVISLGLVVLGVLGLLSGSGAGLGFGALCLFIGVILSGPMLAVLASKLFRPLTSRFGLEGRLAADNTARNPQRTATTSNALLIGVYLVTLVTVAGTSLKDFAVGEINKLAGADFFLDSRGGTLDDDIVTQIEQVDGVLGVATFRRVPVTLDGEASAVSSGDFAKLNEVASVDLESGSFDDLDGNSIIITGSVVVGSSAGSSGGPQIGDKVTVVGLDGASTELTVVGVAESSLDVAFTGSFVAPEAMQAIAGEGAPTSAFVDVEDGTQSDVEEAINDIIAVRPDITLSQGSQFGEIIGGIFDFLINAVNGLLLMSVAVALIGIVNTMSLSIIERRRELGLLRVVGMVDRRVRRMVRIESVMISALGTITGLIVGGVTGWALVRFVSQEADGAISFSAPWGLLAIVLVLGIVLGFLAALIPAQRSTRLEVLESIQAT